MSHLNPLARQRNPAAPGNLVLRTHSTTGPCCTALRRAHAKPLSRSCCRAKLAEVEVEVAPGITTPVQGFNELELLFLHDEIFREQCYTASESIHLKPGDTVIDVGANVGLFSMFAMQRVGTRGRIVAIEALPPVHAVCQANIERLAARGGCRIGVLNSAVGECDGGTMRMTFFKRAAGWGTSSPAEHSDRIVKDLAAFIENAVEDEKSPLYRSTPAVAGRFLKRRARPVFDVAAGIYGRLLLADTATFEVPRVSVSGVLAREHLDTVDLLKVDTEGAEVQVLKGIAQPDWGKIKQIAIEVHSRALLEETSAVLSLHYDCIDVQQSENMAGAELYLVYATRP